MPVGFLVVFLWGLFFGCCLLCFGCCFFMVLLIVVFGVFLVVVLLDSFCVVEVCLCVLVFFDVF